MQGHLGDVFEILKMLDITEKLIIENILQFQQPF